MDVMLFHMHKKIVPQLCCRSHLVGERTTPCTMPPDIIRRHWPSVPSTDDSTLQDEVALAEIDGIVEMDCEIRNLIAIHITGDIGVTGCFPVLQLSSLSAEDPGTNEVEGLISSFECIGVNR
jgi:hypothetical protein